MFNVYPYEIIYTRTESTGVIRGIPIQVTVGVSNEHEGRRLFEQLIAANPTVSFTNYRLRAKKLVK